MRTFWKWFVYILFFILILGLYFAMTWQMTIQHEDVHKANCELIHGNVTEYVATPFGGHINCTYYSYNMTDSMLSAYFLSDSVNEIVTYNNQAIIQLLYLKPKELMVVGFDFTMNFFKDYEDFYRMFRTAEKSELRLNKTYDQVPNLKHSTIFEKYIMKKLWIKYKFNP